MKWGRGLIVYLTIVAILYGTQDLAAISALAQVLAQYSKTPLRHRGVGVEYLERRRGIVEEGYARYGPQTPEGMFGGGGFEPTGGLSYAQAGVGGGVATQPHQGTSFSQN